MKMRVPVSIPGRLILVTGQELEATLMVHSDGTCCFVADRGLCYRLNQFLLFTAY